MNNTTTDPPYPLKDILKHSAFVTDGVFMVGGNLLLMFVLLRSKVLRARHEMMVFCGLVLGDLLYGIGYLTAGAYRIAATLGNWPMTTRWACVKTLHVPFLIVGAQANSIMLALVSLDRLLAVKWPTLYMGLTTKYSMIVVGTTYAYSLGMMAAIFVMSWWSPRELNAIPVCISTMVVNMDWFPAYEPTIQMVGGIASILIFILTLTVRKQQLVNNANRTADMNRQKKMTRVIGTTVLTTLLLHVIPSSIILILGQFHPVTAGKWSPVVWVVSAWNSIANIFIFGVRSPDVNKELRKILCIKSAAPIHPSIAASGPNNNKIKRFSVPSFKNFEIL